ncbi:MAG: acyltransferase [Terrimicrobiaceae bacterium]
MSAGTRSIRIDAMRFIASFAVIGIHSFGFIEDMFERGGHKVDFLWPHVCLRWSVPLFVMLTGALMIGSMKTESALIFLKRRFAWLLPVLTFWVLFYSTIRLVTNHDHTLGSQIIAALTGRPFLHLWYLYLLPGLYLAALPLSAYARSSTRKDVWIFFVCCALLLFLEMGLAFLMPRSTGLTAWPFWFIAYIPYFILGFLLLRQMSVKLGVGLFATGILLSGTMLTCNIAGGLFMHYCSPGVMLMSAGAFIVMYSMKPAHPEILRALLNRRVCSMALGIYFVHPAFLAALKRLHYDWTAFHPFVAACLLWIVVFLASATVVLVMQRIPFLKKVV